jgi:hypothetical protein
MSRYSFQTDGHAHTMRMAASGGGLGLSLADDIKELRLHGQASSTERQREHQQEHETNRAGAAMVSNRHCRLQPPE